MLQKKSFVKKTKGGKVVKVVREHYLRDDIWSGCPLDPACDPSAHKLAADAKHYLVIDTNVALHQMDFLEHPAITDVIVCRTVVEEVEHRNKAGSQRLKNLCQSGTKRFYVFANEHHKDTYVKEEPGESPNDRNDRAIRVVAKWYADRLPQMPVILLTNDAGNLAAAAAMGVNGMNLRAYTRSRTDAPELQDLVARQEFMDEDDAALAAEGIRTTAAAAAAGPGPGSTRDAAAAAAAARGSKRKRVYEQHRPLSELQSGIAAGRYHHGALRVNRFNPFEGWVSSESVGQDILISGRVDMNRAIDGDIVCLELLPESQWKGPSKVLPGAAAAAGAASPSSDDEAAAAAAAEAVDAPVAEIFQVAPEEDLEGPAALPSSVSADGRRPTGRVVGIIRRNWRSRGYCGSLKHEELGPGSSTHSVLFVPVDRRYPMIRLQTRQAVQLIDKRIVAAIDDWTTDSMYPSGHYVRTLGVIGDRDTETEVLLIENDINTAPFSPAVHECVPPLPWAVTEADIADPHREDLRHLCVCSVDPPGCMDIDDALHVRELPNGNLEVGVHIADVTHFLLPSTAMDIEAASRATTTYLVQRRIDMLPKPLTEDICSLRGGVERLAFSVLWEMTPDAVAVSVRFTKSVIASRAALTYAQAQARIDDPSMTDEVTISLRHMLRLSKLLRDKRYAAGALQLASPEVKFKIDTAESLDPMDVGMYQTLETNSMVEEMMLMANVSVAEAIVKRFPSCSLLRRHQTPEPRQFEPLLAAAASAGFSLDVSSSKALAASLDEAVRANDPYFNKLVRIMATRCMTQAQYFGSGEVAPSEYRHYGLASSIYTHFTSPIRRYADVVVHRLLAAAIGIAPLPDSLRDKEALHDCSSNLNTRHRNAQMAGRASVELYTLMFFKDQSVLADARVVKVKANGLVVFVPKYGIEGPVYLVPKDAANNINQQVQYILDEEKQTVTSSDGSVRFAVFDKCAVRIAVEEGAAHRRSLVLSLVPRNELPAADMVG